MQRIVLRSGGNGLELLGAAVTAVVVIAAAVARTAAVPSISVVAASLRFALDGKCALGDDL